MLLIAFYCIFAIMMYVFFGVWAAGAVLIFCAIDTIFHMRFFGIAEEIIIQQRQEIEKLRNK